MYGGLDEDINPKYPDDKSHIATKKIRVWKISFNIFHDLHFVTNVFSGHPTSILARKQLVPEI